MSVQRASRRPRRGDRRGGCEGALGGGRRPPRLPARRLHPDRLRPGQRDRRLAALRRALDRRLPGPRAQRELLRRAPPAGGDHQDRQRPRPAPAGRGGLAPARRPRPSRELARRREGQPALVRERAVAAERRLHRRWRSFDAPRQALHGGRRGRRPRARRLVLEPCRHGRLKAAPGRRGERVGRARGACATQL